VHAFATGDGSPGASIARCQPSNQRADDRGSIPRVPGTCFFTFARMYTSALRTSRGVASILAWYRSLHTTPRRPSVRLQALAARMAKPWTPRASRATPIAFAQSERELSTTGLHLNWQ
jgi:hypothetical protein